MLSKTIWIFACTSSSSLSTHSLHSLYSTYTMQRMQFAISKVYLIRWCCAGGRGRVTMTRYLYYICKQTETEQRIDVIADKSLILYGIKMNNIRKNIKCVLCVLFKRQLEMGSRIIGIAKTCYTLHLLCYYF